MSLRYLLPVAACFLCCCLVAHADTERLRSYYESLLESEPGNERARAFLGLPIADDNLQPVDDSGKAEHAWLELLEDGSLESALAAWEEAWAGASPRERPNLAAAAIEKFSAEMLLPILDAALPSFAPDSPARQILLNATAIRLIDSREPETTLAKWMQRAQQGDLQFARAAAILASRTGRAREWAEMLQLQVDGDGQPEQLWEAWLAAGENERAEQLAADWFARSPDSHRALLAHVEMLLLSGRDEAAGEALQQWLAGQPPAGRAALQQNLPAFADRLGWHSGKETSLRMQLDTNPEDLDARLALLEHLLLWREPVAARELLGESLKISPRGEDYTDFLEKTVALQTRFGMRADAAQTARMAFAEARRSGDCVVKSRVLLLLVDTLRLSGQNAEAIAILQTELAPGKSPLPAPEMDREFFTLIARPENALPPRRGNGSQITGRAITSLDLRGVIPARRGLTPEVQAMLESLRGQADTSVNEEPWLRLARWQEWTEDPAGAEATLQSALLRWPDSARLRESALSLARGLRNREREMELLRELSEREIEASRREQWQRELAFLRLQSEEPRESNKAMIFLMGRAVNPDAPATAWRDLALAHELRDEWFAAWQSWCAAWQTATNDELRAEIRVGGEGAAKRIGRLDEWRAWTGAQSGKVSSGAIPEEVTQAGSGNASSAPAKDLRTLRARNPGAWIDEARRLESADVPAEVLIDFWREAARRFPKSPEALRASAAGLRQESPGEAASLLLQANEYSPSDAMGAFDLAQLLEETGDRTRALDFYREVLELAPPPLQTQPLAVFPVTLTPSERNRLPSMIFRLRAASGTWSGGWAAIMESPPTAPPCLRIRSLRALGRILSQSTAFDPEQKKLTGELCVAEAVEFAVACGNFPDALKILRGHIARNPLDYPATLSFYRIAMAAGLWGEALRFVEEGSGMTPERADFFLAALAERILAGKEWKALLKDAEENVLPENLRWPVAQLLAETGNRREALALAKAAIPQLPLEIHSSAMEQALEWSLRIGDPASARSILEGHPLLVSDLLEPDAALVRARFLLAPQTDRMRWMDESFSRPANEYDLSVASSRFLLAALGGLPLDEEASRLTDEISNATFGGSDRRMFVAKLRMIAEKLLAWRLEEAASALVASALEGDEALRILRGQIDEWQRGELQILATAAALAQQPFATLPGSVSSMRNLLGDNRDFLPAVAGVLAQSGDSLRASVVFQMLWESGDRRPLILSSWWPVVRSAGDTANFKMLLEEFIRRGERVEGVERPHVALIDLALAQRDLELAEAVLLEAHRRGVTEAGLGERETALQFLLGNFSRLRDAHQALWEKEGNILSGEILARAAWLSGQRDSFFELMRDIAARNPAVFLRVLDAALAEPSLQNEDAARLLELLRAHAPQDRERLFVAGVAAGDFAVARDLVGRDGWFPSPDNLMLLSSNREAARALGPVILAAWEDLVENDSATPPTASQWLAVDSVLVASELENQWLEALRVFWRDGRGHAFAGESLLRSLSRSGMQEELRTALATFLETRESGKFWPGLADVLMESGFPELALDVLDGWEKAGIPDEEKLSAALLRASALHRCGKTKEAREILEPWEQVAALDTGHLLPVANWMYEFQFYRRALRLHEEGMRIGPRNLRKTHAYGAARAARALDNDVAAEEYRREAEATPGAAEL